MAYGRWNRPSNQTILAFAKRYEDSFQLEPYRASSPPSFCMLSLCGETVLVELPLANPIERGLRVSSIPGSL